MELSSEDKSNSRWGVADILSLVAFWVLGLIVFAQFFTRYALNSPLGWTEEVARYLLICVGFLGASIGVRRRTHIFLEFFHRYLPHKQSYFVMRFVDIVRIVFFGTLAVLAARIMPIMYNQRMTAIPVRIAYLYGVILFSLAVMTIYSVLIFWRSIRQWKKQV